MVLQIPPPPKEATAKLSKPSFTTSKMLNVILFLIAASLGLILTFTATDERDRADANASTALTLADQIQTACTAGTIPFNYSHVCQQADEAESQVRQVEQGPRGLQGQQGIQGERGFPGIDGSTGPTGPQGIQGPKGDKGDPGIPGQDGNDGIDGQDGIDGTPGQTGPAGIPGEDGEPPLSWTTERADGSIETCNRRVPFDVNAPRYDCTITEPAPTTTPPPPTTVEGG